MIIANWKMNVHDPKEAQTRYEKIARHAEHTPLVDTMVAVPHTLLSVVHSYKKPSNILATQDVFWEDTGAYTGYTSPITLRELRVRGVILGHSERRAHGETSSEVCDKIRACLRNDLVPIVCVGETEQDENGAFWEVFRGQLHETFSGFTKEEFDSIVIAYEPVWAISTTENRRDATPDDAREAMTFIKKEIDDMTGNLPVGKIRTLYGGSVTRDNARAFLETPHVDGLLVGSASVDPSHFIDIVRIAEEITKHS